MIYYNEIDKKKALWLKELMAAGVIAEGVIDTRSIEDVKPTDLLEYTQCHFFAGIGVWSYALRLAGWPDDRPVWTGSCPCQPFSPAGKRQGFADDRHLWPAWFWLIRNCQPVTIFGEQVAGKDGLAWLDTVQADLEGQGYSFGATDLCAAGFGAPHIRQRLYFLGHDDKNRLQGSGRCATEAGAEHEKRVDAERFGADGDSPIRNTTGNDERRMSKSTVYGQGIEAGGSSRSRSIPATNTCGDRLQGRLSRRKDAAEWQVQHRQARCSGSVGPTNGWWRECDWIPHKDGKLRPVEPGTFPLVDGSPARVLRVCGYGDAIVAQVAQGFIEASMEEIENLIQLYT